ncbi:MAG: DNA internalization-related competence protein ComEC/Rec2 [Aestuariibacter sp.]
MTAISLYHRKWLICGCLSGVLWMASVGHSISLWQLPNAAFSKPVTVKVKILSAVLPGKVTKFDAQVLCSESDCFSWFQPRIRLSWYRPDFIVQQGQEVKLLVKLKPPYGLANQFGFNYQQWLFSRRINATGYVKASAENKVLSEPFSIRQDLLNRIDILPDDNKRWLMAMSLGFREGFSDEDWQLLQATGTSHLFAISGLHLGMVAANCYLLAGFLLLLVMPLLTDINRFHLRRCALIIALFGSAGFCYLSGFAIPTLRALVLQAVLTMLLLCNLNWSVRRIVLSSLFSVLIVMPLSPWQMSFWLSYGAILCLTIIGWRFINNGKRTFGAILWQLAKLQALLSVLMMPLVVYQFGGISVIAPVVNIIAVPLVTFVLLPLSLLSTGLMALQFELAPLLTELTLALFELSQQALEVAVEKSPAWFASVSLSLSQTLCLAIACILLVLPTGLWPRWWALVFVVPALSQFATSGQYVPSKNQLQSIWKLHVFDVGQGLAMAIERGPHILLVDTGASFPSGFSMSNAVLIPFLKARGVHYLPGLIVSHDDNDHAGGLEDLLQVYPVAKIIRSGQGCNAGSSEQWHGLEIIYLWPEVASGKIDNHHSCVLKISDGQHSILLPGDIEKRAEKLLLQRNSGNLRANVLIAPHHGSNTSSSSAFLKAVAPDLAVFAQGFGNRWGFPAKEVIARYQQLDIKTLRTSFNGQITLVFVPQQPMKIIRQRQDRMPRWYLPANN